MEIRLSRRRIILASEKVRLGSILPLAWIRGGFYVRNLTDLTRIEVWTSLLVFILALLQVARVVVRFHVRHGHDGVGSRWASGP